MKKSRKLAWVVLGVVVLAVALVLARPSTWDALLYRHVERVYWPDGSLRFEFRQHRWGDQASSLYEKSPSTEGTTTQSGGQGIMTLSRIRPDGGKELFIFPGNKGVPDLMTDGSFGNEAAELEGKRRRKYGLRQ